MHFHAGFRRRLVDLDKRLYRTSEIDAVAVADAIDLPHRQLFVAPKLAQRPGLQEAIERRTRSHRRRNRLFDLVGILALVTLASMAMLGI
ncbi:MAG: hypothetical protein WBG92_04685 [Thiohalocapsa sp.]